MNDRLASGTVSNWGRWGAEDHKGTANFITAEVIVAATQLVRRGKVFSCGIPIDGQAPVFPGRKPPEHVMTLVNLPVTAMGFPGNAVMSDDYITLFLQGGTQWDSLSHVGYDGRLYNDVPVDTVSAQGATANHIGQLHSSMVSRGVLLDIARYKDADGALSPDYGVTIADLEGCMQAQGVEVRSGDILCVRTGWLPSWYTLQTDEQRQMFFAAQPGMALETAEWLWRREVAGIAVDNTAVERMPSEVEGDTVPFHKIAIRDMGLSLGENFYFEELAADCAADGVYEFMLVAQPLHIPNAVGGLINPLALK